MEKETFYSILEELSSYNFKSYFENTDWYKESLASQVEAEAPFQNGEPGSLRADIISHMDDLHKRRFKFFEKKFKSYQELESKEPRLILVNNHPAERYLYIPWINWENYDLMKNPNELINLRKGLKNKKSEEIFYQPVNTKFLDDLEIFIKSKVNLKEEETKIQSGAQDEKDKNINITIS